MALSLRAIWSSVFALTACAASPEGAPPAQNDSAASPPSATAAAAFEKVGIVAPGKSVGLSIWPEQYSGALLVLDVRPHGSQVAEGDVVVTLDTTAIDDEIHRNELELQSATINYRGMVERNRLESDSAKLALDLARSGLSRAQRSLDGWKTRELAFAKRSDEISKHYEQANVEDQTDELDQLTKMYEADALVDATEDIVIKRSRRQLDLTKTSNQLSRDRATYRDELELAMQTEQREEQVRSQSEALARLQVQQGLDAIGRQDAELRSADALREQERKLAKLRKDREKLVIRAPRAGTLLHGAAKDYRPGKSPARWERGSQLAFRTEFVLVADPAPSAVALDLNDSELGKLAEGARVRVELVGPTKATAIGTVRIERTPRSSNANEAVHEATVSLNEGLDGAVYGQRAKVIADASETKQP